MNLEHAIDEYRAKTTRSRQLFGLGACSLAMGETEVDRFVGPLGRVLPAG
jgi:hypothetical protein